MSQHDVTPWFSALTPPVRAGVYQVRPRRGVQWWSYYRNGVWHGTVGSYSTPNHAMRFGLGNGPTQCRIIEWRGLAQEPK